MSWQFAGGTTNTSELKNVDVKAQVERSETEKERDRVFQVQIQHTKRRGVPGDLGQYPLCVPRSFRPDGQVEKGEQVRMPIVIVGVSCCRGGGPSHAQHVHNGGVCCEKFGEFCCEP